MLREKTPIRGFIKGTEPQPQLKQCSVRQWLQREKERREEVKVQGEGGAG